MRIYSDIYDGASTQHIAGAITIGKRALILERTIHAASDYIESLYPCADEQPNGQVSGAIRAMLDRQGYIKEGIIHPHAAEPALFSMLHESGANALFMTEIISVEMYGERIKVTALCLDVVKEFLCDRFHQAATCKSRSLNVLAVVDDSFRVSSQVKIYPTIYPSLRILSVHVGENSTWEQARKAVCSIKGIQIVHLPSVFSEFTGYDYGFLGAMDIGEKRGLGQ